jgi:hypothetical protein
VARRSRRPLWLSHVGIDDFRKVNDDDERKMLE